MNIIEHERTQLKLELSKTNSSKQYIEQALDELSKRETELLERTKLIEVNFLNS